MMKNDRSLEAYTNPLNESLLHTQYDPLVSRDREREATVDKGCDGSIVVGERK
jgi:hypothetical protein